MYISCTHYIDDSSAMEVKWKLLKIVKYLQTLSAILGLSVPNLYKYKGIPLVYIVYCFFLFLILLSMLIYLITIQIMKILHSIEDSVIILVMFQEIALMLLIISSMLSALVGNRRKIVKLCLFMDNLEDYLINK